MFGPDVFPPAWKQNEDTLDDQGGGKGGDTVRTKWEASRRQSGTQAGQQSGRPSGETHWVTQWETKTVGEELRNKEQTQ